MLDNIMDRSTNMALPERNDPVRHSSLIDRTNRSAYTFAFGA